MSTQKNTASTVRQNGGRTVTDFIIAKNTSEFSKRKRRCNTYSLTDWMTRNDLCNYTFMFYVIIVRVDPLKQIIKPKNRFDLKWLNDDLIIVQQPEGVTLQKYPQTRLLVILVEEVV